MNNNGFKRIKHIHSIVADHFLERPAGVVEINHKDLNKGNNNKDNLEYITHQQNILHARQNKHWVTGFKPGHIISQPTRDKMAAKKYKKVTIYNDNQRINFDSIEELCQYMKTYRKKFNRYVNSCMTLNGFYIRYINPS